MFSQYSTHSGSIGRTSVDLYDSLDLYDHSHTFEGAPTWKSKIFVATFDAMVGSVSDVVIDELSHLHHHNLPLIQQYAKTLLK